MRQIAGCNGGNCPATWLEGDDALIRGTVESSPAVLAKIGDNPNGEGVVRIPRAVLIQAARALLNGGELR